MTNTTNIIAIPGGSGGLGRAIVDALKKENRYKVIVLARKADEALETKLGVTVVQADYTNVDSLVQLLEKNNVDTVISTIAGYDKTSETTLIKAANQSAVTKRFIPSVWSGFNYTREQAKLSPPAAGVLTLIDALEATSLEWTAIYPGVFTDFYALSVPSYAPKSPMAIDIDGNAAAIPGSGTYPMIFTHTFDIAKYTVALLDQAKWEPKYFVAGDTKTWNEVIALAEAAKGVKFDVTYDSIEKLEKGEIGELPGHLAMYEAMGGPAVKPMFQKVLAQLAVWMAEGKIRSEQPLLNDMFPDIRPLTMEDALAKA